jgi:hypothetical protein
LYSNIFYPFEKSKFSKVVVKAIDLYGDEVLKAVEALTGR